MPMSTLEEPPKSEPSSSLTENDFPVERDFDLRELNTKYPWPNLDENKKRFNEEYENILGFLKRKAYKFYDNIEKSSFKTQLRDELVDLTIHKCGLNLYQYNQTKGSFFSWINKIMQNTYIDTLREMSKGPVLTSFDESLDNIPNSDFDPSEMIFSGYALQEKVLEIIILLYNEHKINEKETLILRDVLLNEKGYAEIALKLGMTNSNNDRQTIKRIYLKKLPLIRMSLAKDQRFGDLLTT
jgi:DNA-directed RNA polymerase specialized sigma24 family protein